MTDSENAQIDIDIALLSRTELKNKYPNAYNSWRNRKAKTKPHGNWDPAFENFTDFLRIMRAPPTLSHTLDRTDNDDPRYGPGLCEWKNKTDQANNRSSTVRLEDHGIIKPVSQIAQEAGLPPRGIRRLVRSGAFDATGWLMGERPRDATLFGRDPHSYKPWPYTARSELLAMWETEFLASGGVQKHTRFEYLFKRLDKLVAALNVKINYEIGELSGNPEDYKEVFEQIERTKRCRIEAAEQYKRWEREIRIFDAKQYELGQTNARRNARYARFTQPATNCDDD